MEWWKQMNWIDTALQYTSKPNSLGQSEISAAVFRYIYIYHKNGRKQSSMWYTRTLTQFLVFMLPHINDHSKNTNEGTIVPWRSQFTLDFKPEIRQGQQCSISMSKKRKQHQMHWKLTVKYTKAVTRLPTVLLMLHTRPLYLVQLLFTELPWMCSVRIYVINVQKIVLGEW